MKVIFKIIILTVLFIFSKYQAQNLIFLDKDTMKQIDSVNIYEKEKFITQYRISTTNDLFNKIVDSVTFVKENYEDISISISDLKKSNTFFLKKNKYYSIEEVIIKNINPTKVLDKILSAEQYFSSSCKKNYYHLKYTFKSGKDLIQEYNGRLTEEYAIYKLENSKFVNKMNLATYSIRPKQSIFLTKTDYSNIGNIQIYPILYKVFIKNKNIEKYNLQINGEKDNLQRLTFSPKKMDGLMYNGYIVFDKNNHRVFEVKVNLIPNGNNKFENLKFINFSLFIKNKIIEKNCIKLEYAIAEEEFTVIKGVGKNMTFNAKSFIEETPTFDDISLKEFDLKYFKFK